MKKALIGYTGFVGSNLLKQTQFTALYNSKNIQDIRGLEYDMIICAGVSATKWLANQQPEADLEKINSLIANLQHVKTDMFVLISTIDIYDQVNGVTEKTIPDQAKQEAYGRNRYFLEQWVRNHYKNFLILRLPGLFGDHLKKNFIYDLSHPLPASIMPALWSEIEKRYNGSELSVIQKAYQQDHLGNYRLTLGENNRATQDLIQIFAQQNISSLMFTDSRSYFQFYPLSLLWQNIEHAVQQNIAILNLAVEPIQIKELVQYLYHKEFSNIIADKPPLFYNMQSDYDSIFGGKQGYLYDRQFILKSIKTFLEAREEN